jgi:hypothetical protein
MMGKATVGARVTQEVRNKFNEYDVSPSKLIQDLGEALISGDLIYDGEKFSVKGEKKAPQGEVKVEVREVVKEVVKEVPATEPGYVKDIKTVAGKLRVTPDSLIARLLTPYSNYLKV